MGTENTQYRKPSWCSFTYFYFTSLVVMSAQSRGINLIKIKEYSVWFLNYETVYKRSLAIIFVS